MADIKTLFAPATITGYWTQKEAELEPYFLESKFSNRKQTGTRIKWLKGQHRAPRVLSLSAFNADSTPRIRGDFEISEAKVPYFKNHYELDEEMQDKIFNLIATNNNSAINVAMSNVFDDAGNLRKDAALTREYMRAMILTTGVLTLESNGQAYEYDYGIPAAHKVAPTVKWSVSATATPVDDILAWKRLIIESTGRTPKEILLNSTTLNDIAKAVSIKNAFFANNAATTALTPKQAKAFIEDATEMTLYVYDKGITNDDGTFTKFVPDGTVVLMPEEELGKTVFCDTPEERNTRYGLNKVAKVSIIDTGVAITSKVDVDPVIMYIKASMACMPTFELSDSVIIASVH